MSHFTRVSTKIKNLQNLFRALDKLNLKYAHAEQGVEVRGWRGQKAHAEAKIEMGKYDIGIVLAEDGSYQLEADWWGIETTVGKTEQEVVDEINKEYAYVCVVQACEEQGYQIAREDVSVAEDGTVKLLATRWS